MQAKKHLLNKKIYGHKRVYQIISGKQECIYLTKKYMNTTFYCNFNITLKWSIVSGRKKV